MDTDVDLAGLVALVHLLAYLQRTMLRIEGHIRKVSANCPTAPSTGEAYFAARVEIDRQQLGELATQVGLRHGTTDLA